MTYILRCDAPGCTNKATIWGVQPAGWTQAHNSVGEAIHACPTVGHLAAARATTAWVATAAVA